MQIPLTTLLLVILCSVAQAQEVTTTGFGSNYDEALQNAKVSATEVAAGTFITGNRELVNGNYSESIGQYNGGIVQHVIVKSAEETDGLYKVVIKAEVNLDKVNRVIIPNNVPISTRAVDAVNNMRKALDTWNAINKASHPFTIVTDSVKFDVIDQSTVKIGYSFHAKWNPKWVDDVKQFVKVAGHSINQNTRAMVCINSLGYVSDYDCYEMSAIPHKSYLPRTIKYVVILNFRDGTSVQYETASMGVYSNHTQTQSTYYFNPYRKIRASWFRPGGEAESMDINEDITVAEYREFTVSPSEADKIAGMTIKTIYDN